MNSGCTNKTIFRSHHNSGSRTCSGQRSLGQDELREKFNLHFWSYTKGTFTDPYKQTCTPSVNPWNTQNLILVSSHLVRCKERMQELLEAEQWDLVILDEAHHAHRKSPQNREDTPNRRLELMKQLRAKTRALILLSATPMQIDPIEVFDFLSVLGLDGQWANGDQFCDYCASLSSQPNRQTLKFWHYMSADYFARGGLPCPQLKKYLEKNNRFLAHRVQDTWLFWVLGISCIMRYIYSSIGHGLSSGRSPQSALHDGGKLYSAGAKSSVEIAVSQ